MRYKTKMKALVAILIVLSPAVGYADLDDLDDPSQKPVPTAQPNLNDLEPNLGSPGSKTPLPTNTPPPPPLPPGKTTNTPAKRSTAAPNKHDSKQPINWKSRGMTGSKKEKIVDLNDDVIVTQGDLKLEADKARVFFDANDDVSKVVATGVPEKNNKANTGNKSDPNTGTVKVTKAASLPEERMSARANEAIFDNHNRTVTMIGRAAMWRGSDVVRGKQITYFVDTGLFKVDSVEGVVQPGDQAEDGFSQPDPTRGKSSPASKRP